MATTRLHAAAAAGDVSAVKMLLSSSTTDTICALDEFGQTPLVLAAEHGRAQVVELLLDNGADPNVPDSRGRSALHWAANQHDEEGVRALLSHKASTHIITRGGESALHWALGESCKERNSVQVQNVVKLLLEAGSDAELVNETGATPSSLTNDASVLRILKANLDERQRICLDEEKAAAAAVPKAVSSVQTTTTRQGKVKVAFGAKKKLKIKLAS